MAWDLVHEVEGRRKVRWGKVLVIYVVMYWVTLPLIVTLIDLIGWIWLQWPWPWEPDNHWLFWLTIEGVGGVLVMAISIREQWRTKAVPRAFDENGEHDG